MAAGGPRSARPAARLLVRAVAANPTVLEDLHAGVWERLPLELSRSERGGAACAAAGPNAVPEVEGCGLLVWLAARLDAHIPESLRLRAANLLAGAMGKRRLGAAPRHLTSAMYVLSRELLDSRRRHDSRGKTRVPTRSSPPSSLSVTLSVLLCDSAGDAAERRVLHPGIARGCRRRGLPALHQGDAPPEAD